MARAISSWVTGETESACFEAVSPRRSFCAASIASSTLPAPNTSGEGAGAFLGGGSGMVGAVKAPRPTPIVFPPTNPRPAALNACRIDSSLNGSLPFPNSSSRVWPYSVAPSVVPSVTPPAVARRSRPFGPGISNSFLAIPFLPRIISTPNLSATNSRDPAATADIMALAISEPERNRRSLTERSVRSPMISPYSRP